MLDGFGMGFGKILNGYGMDFGRCCMEFFEFERMLDGFGIDVECFLIDLGWILKGFRMDFVRILETFLKAFWSRRAVEEQHCVF